MDSSFNGDFKVVFGNGMELQPSIDNFTSKLKYGFSKPNIKVHTTPSGNKYIRDKGASDEYEITIIDPTKALWDDKLSQIVIGSTCTLTPVLLSSTQRGVEVVVNSVTPKYAGDNLWSGGVVIKLVTKRLGYGYYNNKIRTDITNGFARFSSYITGQTLNLNSNIGDVLFGDTEKVVIMFKVKIPSIGFGGTGKEAKLILDTDASSAGTDNIKVSVKADGFRLWYRDAVVCFSAVDLLANIWYTVVTTIDIPANTFSSAYIGKGLSEVPTIQSEVVSSIPTILPANTNSLASILGVWDFKDVRIFTDTTISEAQMIEYHNETLDLDSLCRLTLADGSGTIAHDSGGIGTVGQYNGSVENIGYDFWQREDSQ